MPLIHKIGKRYNIIDKPDNRKQHKGELIRIGGVGILFGLIIGIVIISTAMNYIDLHILNKSILSIVLIGSTSFFLLGLTDDIYKLNPFIRLIFQILISFILYSNGISFNAIDLSWLFSLGPIPIPSYLSIIITIIWLVGITNAINWIDGLDGLASGISTIYSMGLILIFISLGKWDFVILSACLSGSSIAFLRYNFYPAKILMGDGGSYLLGSSLAIISLFGLSYDLSLGENDLKVFPFHLALIIFFIPVADMACVIFSRILSGLSPFYPDRRHLHHRILGTGLQHRSTVIFYYSISLVFVTLAVYFFDIKYKVIFLCISSTLLGLFLLYCLNMGMVKQLNPDSLPHDQKK